MKGTLFLDIVVRKSAAVLKLLASEDQALLVRRNAFLILDLSFHIVDGVGRLDLERDGLAGECLHKYLHTTAKAKDEMKGRFLLNVVVGESATILELLSSENKTLLIGGDAFLVLNLGLHIVNRVRGLDFQGDSLASKGLNKDLHTTTETKDEMEGGLLLNIVVR